MCETLFEISLAQSVHGGTRFSKTRFPRLLKRRIKAPIQRKSRLNMDRVIPDQRLEVLL